MPISSRPRQLFTALGYIWAVATIVVLGGEVLWPGHHVHVGGEHHHHFFTGPHHHPAGSSAVSDLAGDDHADDVHAGDDHASHAEPEVRIAATPEDPASEFPEESSAPTLIEDFTLDQPEDRAPVFALRSMTSLEPALGSPIVSTAIPRPGSPRGPPSHPLV